VKEIPKEQPKEQIQEEEKKVDEVKKKSNIDWLFGGVPTKKWEPWAPKPIKDPSLKVEVKQKPVEEVKMKVEEIKEETP